MPFYSSLELYSEKDARLQSRTITFFAAQISISIHIYGAAPAVRFGKAVSNLQVKKKSKEVLVCRKSAFEDLVSGRSVLRI